MTEKNKPQEQEAITTTIVGGRPPGCGQPVGSIPRGIEVLVKKAAVDAEFRARLLDTRANAADEIALQLEPSEIMMLNAVPREQLEKIIDNTAVKPEHRTALLGKVAAFMLIALGLQTLSCDCASPVTEGIRPDNPTEQVKPAPPLTKGIRPDRPTEQTKSIPMTQGIRPDTSAAAPEADQATPKPPSTPLSRGIRPDRINKKDNR